TVFSLSFLLVALAQTPSPQALPSSEAQPRPTSTRPPSSVAQEAPPSPGQELGADPEGPDVEAPAEEGDEVAVEQEVPAGLVPPSLRVDAPAIYPEELRESGLNGEVLLILLVDTEGNVEDVA